MTDVSFDQALDFSRGTEATYYDANGTLQTAGPDEPRFTHDPETGEPQGLLIEEQRTNLLLWSEDYAQGAWGSDNATVTPGFSLAPDGSMSSSNIVAAAGSFGSKVQIYTRPNQNTFVFSAFYKAGGGIDVVRHNAFGANGFADDYVAVDLTDGSVVAASVESGNSYSIEPCVGGWYRVALIIAAPSDDIRCQVGRVYDTSQSDGVKGVISWGAQLEQASTPSSYIKTEDAQVTRAADQVSRELGSEFNPSEWVIYVEGESENPANSHNYLWMLSSGSSLTAPWFGLSINPSGYSRVRSSADADIASSTLPGFYDDVSKVALSLDSSGSAKLFYNGQKVAEGINTVDLSQVTHLFFRNGDRGSFSLDLNGTTKNFMYIPFALTESELIALTTPE